MLDFENRSFRTRRLQDAPPAGGLARRGGPASGADNRKALLRHVEEIVEQRRLTALFQPLVDLRNGDIYAYEGFVRGPSDSPLHSPAKLFGAAARTGFAVAVEHLARQVAIQRFVELGLPGKLFLKASPRSLALHDAVFGATLNYLEEIGLDAGQVIVELAADPQDDDAELLYRAAMHYREMGFQIAVEGSAGELSYPELCAALRPEFVKLDVHLVQNIANDPVKRHFVRSIQDAAVYAGGKLIAEGIETHRDLALIRDLGIVFGQGYHLARPSAHPVMALSAELAKTLKPASTANPREPSRYGGATAAKLLRQVSAVSPDTPTSYVYEMFNASPDLHAIPVAKSGIPVGMINRQTLIERLARPYRHELFGKKPCEKFMDSAPLVVDVNISLQELSALIVEGERHHLTNGFIVTEHGYFCGIGTGHDLVREITEMQISAARYANPLTQLPGNVPIDEQIDRLLKSGTEFYICYCDLDHFKPFNDVYGFHKGDEVIKLVAEVLTECCDPAQDFIGHVGGDDFIVLFRSEDWEIRCRHIVKAFGERVLGFFAFEDRERGGYVTEDRQGKRSFQPLTSVSLGVAKIAPDVFNSLHQVSAVASETKKQAKKIPGNSLFVERRDLRSSNNGPPPVSLAAA